MTTDEFFDPRINLEKRLPPQIAQIRQFHLPSAASLQHVNLSGRIIQLQLDILRRAFEAIRDIFAMRG
jgi:hypothetical protein